MKSLMVALMLSAGAAAGLAGTALGATGAPTPPAGIGQPNHPVAAPLSNPMSGTRTMAGGMMASQGGQGGMMHSMMAMMRMMTMMMGRGTNMAGFMAGSPTMGGSSAGPAGSHSPSH